MLAPADRSLLRELVDIRPCDERLISRARDDHRPHAIVVLQREDRAAQFVERLRAERVEDLGTVDGESGDSAFPLDEDVFQSVESHDEESSIPQRRAAPASQPTVTPSAAPAQSART